MPSPVPIREAAAALGVYPSTVRRWVARGAPVAYRGGRGRGRRTLFDVAALESWRRGYLEDNDALRAFAAEVPELVATAIEKQFHQIDGPHKRAFTGELPVVFYEVVSALLDRIRESCPDVPDIPDMPAAPEAIQRLKQIARL